MKATVFKLVDHQWVAIHTGTITGETTTHYKVFSPSCEEWFAKHSRIIRTTIHDN